MATAEWTIDFADKPTEVIGYVLLGNGGWAAEAGAVAIMPAQCAIFYLPTQDRQPSTVTQLDKGGSP